MSDFDRPHRTRNFSRTFGSHGSMASLLSATADAPILPPPSDDKYIIRCSERFIYYDGHNRWASRVVTTSLHAATISPRSPSWAAEPVAVLVARRREGREQAVDL